MNNIYNIKESIVLDRLKKLVWQRVILRIKIKGPIKFILKEYQQILKKFILQTNVENFVPTKYKENSFVIKKINIVRTLFNHYVLEDALYM